MRSHHTLLITACGAALAACAPSPSKPPTPPPNSPTLVGRIATIPPDRRFVLIESYGKWSTPPGTILTSRGPDNRSANLLATGEAHGHFAAADLQSGSLEIGDAVFAPPEILQKNQNPPPPNPQSPPENPKNPPATNPEKSTQPTENE